MPSLPNILLFNPDQWRGDALGYAGHPAAKTPVLDALVEQEAIGMTQAFCQNPVCVPSRCSFMTGLYPHVNGHRTMYHMLHPENGERHLLQVLKDLGYFIWWGGKNDLVDGPTTQGGASLCDVRFSPTEADFERWGGSFRQDPHADESWRSNADAADFYSMFVGQFEKEAGEPYLDSDWCRVLAACEFIQQYKGERPLCVLLTLSYPHPPYGVEEPYFSAIDRAKLPPRAPSLKQAKAKPAILTRIHELSKMDALPETYWDELRATYLGSCHRLDTQFGMTLDALRQAGMYADSAVFFFSDHGDFTGDYDLVEKTQNTFEDCLTRVPFVFKPPSNYELTVGLRKGLVELVDMPATIYDMLGIDPGYDHFGKSLLPLLSEDKEHRDAVFCEGGRRPGETQASEGKSNSANEPAGLYYPKVQAQISEEPFYHTKATMCRTHDWKYVHRQGEADELYDLKNDPFELENRIHDPLCADRISQMRLRLLDWLQQTADTVPRNQDNR